MKTDQSRRACPAWRAVWIGALAVALGGGVAAQEGPRKVRETWPSGRILAEYRVDAEGRRDGIYDAFYEDGKRKTAGHYDHGVRQGKWEEFHPAGRLRSLKVYGKGAVERVATFDGAGRPIHEVLVRDGVVFLKPPGTSTVVEVFPRRRDEIVATLDAIEGAALDPTAERFAESPILSAPWSAGRPAATYLDWGIRRLNAYRYLAGLCHDVALDPTMNTEAQHASVVCASIGTISHTPRRAEGIDPAVHALGFRGAQRSNLSLGSSDLRDAIDGLMDDSDPSNIRAVGHRAWMLNPRMGRAGLGEVGRFHALWAHDGSRSVAAPPLILYPAAGYFPVEYLSPTAVWNLCFDGRIRRLPRGGDLRIRAFLLDADWDLAAELPMAFSAPREGSYGMGRGHLFRPVLPEGTDRGTARILVEAEGFVEKRTAAPLQYVVEFFQRQAPGRAESGPSADPTTGR